MRMEDMVIVSVDDHIVEHYRAGHAVGLRCQSGAATTEDQRQAMIHYRALFDELVGIPGAVRTQLAS